MAYHRGMSTTSHSELRRNLSATIDGLAEDHEPARSTRSDGRPALVPMSQEGLISHEETPHRLHSARNSKRLLMAIEGPAADKGLERLR